MPVEESNLFMRKSSAANIQQRKKVLPSSLAKRKAVKAYASLYCKSRNLKKRKGLKNMEDKVKYLVGIYCAEQEVNKQEFENQPWLLKMLKCHSPSNDKMPVLYAKMRARVLEAEELWFNINQCIVEQKDSQQADELLLEAVRKDYSTSIEMNSAFYINEAIKRESEGQKSIKNKKSGNAKAKLARKIAALVVACLQSGQSGSSYKGTLYRHIFGWVLISGINATLAYYIILFGLNNGPVLTNSWLKSFFIGFLQDLFLYIPIKLVLFYMLLPRINSKEIDMTRLRRLPGYAPSVLVAKRFPQLLASTLILQRTGTPDESVLQNFAVVLAWGTSFRQNWKRVQKIALTLLFGCILLLPFGVQELAWEQAIPVATNYFILNVTLFYMNTRASAFWGGLAAIIVALVILALSLFFLKRLKTFVQRVWTSWVHRARPNM